MPEHYTNEPPSEDGSYWEPGYWVRAGAPVTGWRVGTPTLHGIYSNDEFCSRFRRSVDRIPTPEELAELRAERDELREQVERIGSELQSRIHYNEKLAAADMERINAAEEETCRVEEERDELRKTKCNCNEPFVLDDDGKPVEHNGRVVTIRDELEVCSLVLGMLVDKHEGSIVTEEFLQGVLADAYRHLLEEKSNG
jgi:hypothetical protein